MIKYGLSKSINKTLGTYRFTDAMLGLFLDEFRKTERGKNSFVIVAADHGSGKDLIEPDRNTRVPVLQKYQVPLLFLYPENQQIEQKVISTLGGQPDILPTILDVLGIEADFPVFGKSLIRDYQYRFVKGVIDGGWLLTKDRFYKYYPQESVSSINGEALSLTLEDQPWLNLNGEIDDIQDWIIQQKDRSLIKQTLNRRGWY